MRCCNPTSSVPCRRWLAALATSFLILLAVREVLAAVPLPPGNPHVIGVRSAGGVGGTGGPPKLFP